MRSNFEGLSLRNIESLQEIILPIQKEILKIVEDNSYLENSRKNSRDRGDNSYLGNKVKMSESSA